MTPIEEHDLKEGAYIGFTLLSGSFLDLAVTLGRRDPGLAFDTLQALEESLAGKLGDLKDELTERVGGSANFVLRAIAGNLRQTFEDARQRIEQAQNPH